MNNTIQGMKAGKIQIIAGKQGAGKSIYSEIVDKINNLSADAYYICGTFYFGALIGASGYPKGVFNSVSQDADETIRARQQNAFDELLNAGFCHGDVERGVHGYRSTEHGRIAWSLIRQHDKRTDGYLG